MELTANPLNDHLQTLGRDLVAFLGESEDYNLSIFDDAARQAISQFRSQSDVSDLGDGLAHSIILAQGAIDKVLGIVPTRSCGGYVGDTIEFGIRKFEEGNKLELKSFDHVAKRFLRNAMLELFMQSLSVIWAYWEIIFPLEEILNSPEFQQAYDKRESDYRGFIDRHIRDSNVSA
jgi:hypothetical protein